MKQMCIVILVSVLSFNLFSTTFSDIVTEVIQCDAFDKKLRPMKTELLAYLRDNASGQDIERLNQALSFRKRSTISDEKGIDFNPNLMFAIFLGCEKTIDTFIDQGFHYTKEGTLSNMPLLVATVIGNLKLMKEFYELGCRPEGVKKEHPVHFILEPEEYFLKQARKHRIPESEESVKTRYKECLIYLLSICEPFDCTLYRRNPLKYTVENQLIDEMELLLNAGFPVDSCDEEYVPMVYTAMRTENPELLTKMLEMGVDPNAVNNWNSNVIHELVTINMSDKNRDSIGYQHHEDELLDILLMFGADINHKNERGVTPLDSAAAYGNLKSATLLLENGAVPNMTDGETTPALHWAIVRRNIDMADLILSYHPKTISTKNGDGNTPLHVALNGEDTDSVHYLLKHRADPNIQNNEGQTPLHIAAKKRLHKAIRFLVQSGTNINIKNNAGQSPIFIAVRNHDQVIVKWLIEQGADLTIKDLNGKVPMEHTGPNDIQMRALLGDKHAQVLLWTARENAKQIPQPPVSLATPTHRLKR